MNRRIIVAIMLGASVIAIASVALSRAFLPIARDTAYVDKGTFERHGTDTLTYLANIYIDGKVVRRIFIVVPLYAETLQPLRIHIPVVENSVIKSLEVVFEPPPWKALELAWSVTTINAYVRYYRAGRNIVWRCDDMGFYGTGTVTLDFFPLRPRLDYFAGVSLAISMTLNYKGSDYRVFDIITISYEV